jgi:hypothetical protein
MLINNKWYDEGRLACKMGKRIEDCPYKVFSYGYAQWRKGYIHYHECMS